MRSLSPGACLDLDLLRYVRDAQPTEDELVGWLGPSDSGCYHVLRKAGLLVLRDGRVELPPEHLSPDRRSFWYESRWFDLDESVVRMVCRGPAV
jgi:hypothetical protein